jgi:hypothetical protein
MTPVRFIYFATNVQIEFGRPSNSGELDRLDIADIQYFQWPAG